VSNIVRAYATGAKCGSTANIARHIQGVIESDVFHVSANTDPKGDRSKPPQEQDPDMMMHAVKETDQGIIVRGAKYETAAGYADQAFSSRPSAPGPMRSFPTMPSAASSRWASPA
jgi:aromatic ring hydroxylase